MHPTLSVVFDTEVLQYSTLPFNSEMFDWQKAFFFTSLNLIAFIHNGRFQIVTGDRGLHTDRIFFSNLLWFVFYTDICLSVRRSVLYQRKHACTPEID